MLVGCWVASQIIGANIERWKGLVVHGGALVVGFCGRLRGEEIEKLNFWRTTKWFSKGGAGVRPNVACTPQGWIKESLERSAIACWL